MGISYLIVTLALINMQPDVVVQLPVFMNDRVLLRDTGRGLWLASGGNPWAAPDPGEEYRQGSRQRLPKPMSRRRYITPEELKSLEHVPQQFNGRDWAPPNMGLFENRAYTPPLYGDFGPYGQGRYPLGGRYSTPLSPGIDPRMSPYGGLPYGGMPYEGLSPFRY
jgi:hypothetical protein